MTRFSSFGRASLWSSSALLGAPPRAAARLQEHRLGFVRRRGRRDHVLDHHERRRRRVDPLGARGILRRSLRRPPGRQSFAGPFTVPAGVAVVAQNGARATITGGTAQDRHHARRRREARAGRRGRAAGSASRCAERTRSSRTSPSAARRTRRSRCSVTTAAPRAPSRSPTSSLGKSTIGAWFSGAHVAWTGGASSSNAGTGLTAAAGVIAVDGAHLDLQNVTVEKNEGVGIVIDGAATTAAITNAIVNENGERGIWAQRVNGTLDAPAVKSRARRSRRTSSSASAPSSRTASSS